LSPRRYRLGQREAAVDLTRERILDAARAVLTTQDRFTIDLVAHQADVARMTVYNQFGSKAGLLEALFDWLAQRGGLVRLPAVFQQADADLALEAFVASFCAFWASDRVVLRRLRAMAALDPELGQLIHARDEWRRGGLRTLLARRGIMSPDIVDLLHMLTSFEAFDALAGDQRADEDVRGLVIDAARKLLT
jgi:AcrR family transcriptional regulator